MDRLLYVSMSGAQQTMLAQSANSNNLANSNTSGFRADLNAFRSMPVHGPGYETRVYAMNERSSVDFTIGMVSSTGRDLDIAVIRPHIQEAFLDRGFGNSGDVSIIRDAVMTG